MRGEMYENGIIWSETIESECEKKEEEEGGREKHRFG